MKKLPSPPGEGADRTARATTSWPIWLAAPVLLFGAATMSQASGQPVPTEVRANASAPSPAHLNKALVAASASGNLEEISRLLKLGANPNINEGYDQVSALFAAARSNQTEAVKFLLAKGADPNNENGCGNKVITWVLSQGNLPMAALLREAGAKIDPLLWAGATGDHTFISEQLSTAKPEPEAIKKAYKFAAAMGRLETVKFIEQITGQPIPGSFLTQAAQSGNIPMMEYILGQGADLRKDGGEAIDRAVIFFDQPASVKFLLARGVDPNRVTEWGDHLVSSVQSSAVMKVLLEAGADPNATDDRKVPLAVAPDAESVRLLVKYGANPQKFTEPFGSLLEQTIVAELNDRAETVAELIKQGAAFDPQGNGATAIVSAAFFNQIHSVKALLDLGVSPNAVCSQTEARSALASAAYQGSPELLQLLLDRGADPNGSPSDTFSPLCNAAMSGNRPNLEILRKNGATNLSPLAIAAALGDLDRARACLEAGADPNEKDPAGITPLTFTVRRGHPEVARLLLEKGANPNLFSRFGLTAGSYLALMSRPEQAQMQWTISEEEGGKRLAAFKSLFVEYPADPNYQDADGRTYLHQAAWAGNSLLWSVEKSPDPNLRDKEGRPPLLLACLSPRASETEEIITNYSDAQRSKATAVKWNRTASCANALLRLGADPDLAMPGGQTVRSLGIAAAELAGNRQLATLLKDAKKSGRKEDSRPDQKR